MPIPQQATTALLWSKRKQTVWITLRGKKAKLLPGGRWLVEWALWRKQCPGFIKLLHPSALSNPPCN